MTFLGWLSDPLKGLSDLQIGDEKVTLNHLALTFLELFPGIKQANLGWCFERLPMTLKLTANVPLKIGQNPKRETIVFQPSIFRCELLVLGGYPVHLHIKKISNKYVYIYMSYQLQILHKHGWMDTETWWANGVFPGIFSPANSLPKPPWQPRCAVPAA